MSENKQDMAAKPGQAAYEAKCASFGDRHGRQPRTLWESLPVAIRADWEAAAQAAIDAATEGSLRACGYTLGDVGRFLEAVDATQDTRPAPGLAAENTELRAILSRALATFSEPDQFGVCRAVASAHTLSRWGRDAGVTEDIGRQPEPAPELFRVATLGLDACATPGAVYCTEIGTGRLAVDVDFGRELPVGEDDAERLDTAIHEALERILAPYWGTGAALADDQAATRAAVRAMILGTASGWEREAAEYTAAADGAPDTDMARQVRNLASVLRKAAGEFRVIAGIQEGDHRG